jgi:UDP-3-O-[3-hydroxymyristoyl] glucosamine N-acyltransferase
MSMPLTKIAAHLHLSYSGSGDTPLSGLCPLEEGVDSALCFVRDTNASRVEASIASSKAGAFIVHESLKTELKSQRPLLFSPHPQQTLMQIAELFGLGPVRIEGVSPLASIAKSAVIEAGAAVGPFAVVGEHTVVGANSQIHPHVCLYSHVHIGKNCIIHAGAVVREHCRIADHCVIQPGAIIGADGFGYVPDAEIGLKPVPQIGVVELEDRVDIGANACVDRAALGRTLIRRSSKLDNLVQVGHNVQIGQYSILCGQVGIAGSCTIGDRVTLGGQSGVADHVEIGSDIRIAAKSGVTSVLREKGDYAGYPAMNARLWRRMMGFLRRSVRKSSNE